MSIMRTINKLLGIEEPALNELVEEREDVLDQLRGANAREEWLQGELTRARANTQALLKDLKKTDAKITGYVAESDKKLEEAEARREAEADVRRMVEEDRRRLAQEASAAKSILDKALGNVTS